MDVVSSETFNTPKYSHLSDRDKCCKKHYQVVKRKMESRQHNINSQHGDLNLEFVLVKKPKVDEPLDVVDTSATHCTFLREPLLNDVS